MKMNKMRSIPICLSLIMAFSVYSPEVHAINLHSEQLSKNIPWNNDPGQLTVTFPEAGIQLNKNYLTILDDPGSTLEFPQLRLSNMKTVPLIKLSEFKRMLPADNFNSNFKIPADLSQELTTKRIMPLEIGVDLRQYRPR